MTTTATTLPAELAGLGDSNREREYSPSSCIGGHYQPHIAAYRSRSVLAHERSIANGARWQRLAYGPLPTQGIELCLPPAGASSSPVGLLLFIHGGYWQELAAADSLFAAQSCLDQGLAFAAVDYTLAPAATVAQIVDECRRAWAALVAQAGALGIDRGRIVVAGSSAGAHLAAMLAVMAARSPAKTRPLATVLVSGVYWLEPLIGTSINGALGLDLAAARQSSPGLLDLQGFARTIVCWGEIETRAFKLQSEAFAQRLRESGTDCQTFEVAGRNHFDIILDLADPASTLGRQVLARF